MARFLYIQNPNSAYATLRKGRKLAFEDHACPTIMAQAEGIKGVNSAYWWIEEDDVPERKTKNGKPPYRVMSMAEVEAVPWNGLNVVSTFSGAGGSCLGFRMAGYRTLLASEFVESAADVYLLNHPGTPVLTQDVREVEPAMILEYLGMEPGELDVLEGSPPCASFSTAGKRHASWGEVKKYSDTAQRTDDLFFEYVRLLRGIRPKVFVAENVPGLTRGTAKGYFNLILAALKESGYRVEWKLIQAKWLGVPQDRTRVIFQGVREDLGRKPAWPRPLPYFYTLRDAIPLADRHGTAPPHKEWVAAGKQVEATMVSSADEPCPTIVASGENKGAGYVEVRVPVRAVHDRGKSWGAKGDVTDEPCPTITVGVDGLNSEHYKIDEEVRMVPPESLEGTAVGDEWDKLRPGEQSERYFNLVRPDPDQPSPTVTAIGGDRGVAAVTHPTERRKFTISELKRVCAFPDDFILTGTYRQQWERLGRSVPPLMMRGVAEAVRDGPLRGK